MTIFKQYLLVIVVGASFLNMGQAVAKIEVGDSFPLVELKKEYLTKKGKFSPAKAKAKVYIVDFWASWCEPCKKALPTLDKLYRAHKREGLIVIGVNVDDEKKLGKDFISEHKVDFPIVFDKGRRLAEKVEISTMPTSFVLDSKGKVIYLHKGFVDGQGEEYVKQIKHILQK